MCADGKFTYKSKLIKKHVTIYTLHKIYMCIWMESHYRNHGVTSFIIMQKIDVHMDALQTDL